MDRQKELEKPLIVATKEDWDTVCSIVLGSAERCGLMGWATSYLEIFNDLAREGKEEFPGFESDEIQLVVDQYVGEIFSLDEHNIALPVMFKLPPIFRHSPAGVSEKEIPIHDQFLSYWHRWSGRDRWITLVSNNPEAINDPLVLDNGNLSEHLATEDRHPRFGFGWEVVTSESPQQVTLVSTPPDELTEDEVLDWSWDSALRQVAWKVRHFLDTEYESLSYTPAVFIEQHNFDDNEMHSSVILNFMEDPAPEDEAPLCFVIENQVILRDED